MKREDRCSQSNVTLKKVVSLLPTDYANLTSLPTINGISILGDLTSEELSILSSVHSDYETITLSNITDTSTKYLLLLGEDEDYAEKVSLEDFLSETQITVTTDLDEDAAVGSIQFVSYS